MRCNVLLGGAKLYYIPESEAYDKLGEPGIMLHCAKHSMLMLGGLGACPPRIILKNKCSEIEFEGIAGSKYLCSMH